MSDDPMHEILRQLKLLADGQTQLRVDVMARIDRLQTHVDQMADAAFVTYAQGEGIATQISGLVRQVRRLTGRVDALEEK